MYVDFNLYSSEIKVPKNGTIEFKIKDEKIESLRIVDFDKEHELEQEKIKKKIERLKTEIKSKCFNCSNLGCYCLGASLNSKNECNQYDYVEKLEDYQLEHL